ncbi:glycerophosphodiester phosphodiesterase family protein [Bacillus sp. JJ1521]|uniref:glycerophosphodiester phosphodiesterase n=1 Tax=Bacillus sp. JJ1521 TaxID=3122957 RepID=UPI002FFFC4A5
MIKRYLILTLLISVGFATITLAITESEKEPENAGESLIIAHRGANDRFNEHTLTAYRIASKDGVDYLEIDLRMTKDGELVAMHDETINRTTNGKGKVSDYTLEELKKFNTISTFDNKMVSEEIPSLREIFDSFAETENFYIETRLVDNQLAMEEKVIELLKEYNLLNDQRVILQSFSPKSLEKIKSLAPDIPLTLLFKKGKFDLNKAISSNYPIVGIESSEVTNQIVEKLHKNGKKVHVYFTNKKTQKAEQTRMKEFQVDGYFTDYILYTKEL